MTPNIQFAKKAILSTSSQMKTKKRVKPKTNNTRPSSTSSTASLEDKENEKAYEPHPMEHELDAGIALITSFIKNSQVANHSDAFQAFISKLSNDLKSEYTGHWYPERPEKGSAFRCLRINQNGSDSLIEKVARLTNVYWITSCLPKEFTIWIDPGEVSYRIGEEGSICVHFSRKLNNNYTIKRK